MIHRSGDSTCADRLDDLGHGRAIHHLLDNHGRCVYHVDTHGRVDEVQGVVKKWGNSAAVRIPAAVLEAAQVRLDQPVDVREEGGRIVIEPLRPSHYDRERLIAGITDENRHEPVDMGHPVGGEVW